MSYQVIGDPTEVLPFLAAAHFAGKHVHFTAAPAPSSIKLTNGTSVNVEEGLRHLVEDAGAANAESEHFIRLALSHGMSIEAEIAVSKLSSTLRQLLNMGVRQSRVQIDVYDKIGRDATTTATIADLSGRLSSRMYFSGDGNRCGVLDAIVAGGLFDLLSLVLPASLYSSAAAPFTGIDVSPVLRWFMTVSAMPQFAELVDRFGMSTGGRVRVGGQVDLRALPTRVAALADASIEKNAGHKKATSQRESEKATKEAPAPTTPAAVMAGSGEIAAATATQPEGNKTLPTKSVDERIEMTRIRLEEYGITHSIVKHEPAANVEQMLAALASLSGTKCKNLFIKAKKEKAAGDSRMWLVVAAHDTDTNLTALATKLGYGKIVLRFGDAESLVENLGVVTGHVSPFALANDTALQVNVALDSRLLAAEASPLYFHPLTNEASVAISGADLLKFITATGHTYTVVDF